jgi:hypothetical protein
VQARSAAEASDKHWKKHYAANYDLDLLAHPELYEVFATDSRERGLSPDERLIAVVNALAVGT